MPKLTLLIIVLLVIFLTASLTLFLNNVNSKTVPKSEIDTAVNQAKLVYSQMNANKKELANGPCLSNALMPNWVADIVHNPRLPVDDLPENQCPSFLEGRAEHLVELDLDGNLIRAK